MTPHLGSHTFDPHRLLGWFPVATGSVCAALQWASHHTGLPVIVVTAIALVASLRLFKRSMRFAIEVAIVVAILVAAKRLGLIGPP